MDGNTCTLAYGKPQTAIYNFDVSLSELGTNYCRRSKIIDDPIECENSIQSIETYIYIFFCTKYKYFCIWTSWTFLYQMTLFYKSNKIVRVP